MKRNKSDKSRGQGWSETARINRPEGFEARKRMAIPDRGVLLRHILRGMVIECNDVL
ncbi:MAG: hypothetical protein ACOCSE_01360 [Chitinivibrionales bacterium]